MKSLTIEFLTQYRDQLVKAGQISHIELTIHIKKINGKNRRILNKRKHNQRYWIIEPLEPIKWVTT